MLEVACKIIPHTVTANFQTTGYTQTSASSPVYRFYRPGLTTDYCYYCWLLYPCTQPRQRKSLERPALAVVAVADAGLETAMVIFDYEYDYDYDYLDVECSRANTYSTQSKLLRSLSCPSFCECVVCSQ